MPSLLAFSRLIITGLILCAAFASVPALAGPPSSIDVQGRLLDTNGDPVDGSVDVVIRLYTQPVGGLERGREARVIIVSEGLFQVPLDTLGDPELYRDNGENLNWYFGISVSGQAELTPRIRVVTVPFAHVSTSVDGDVETSPAALLISDSTSEGHGAMSYRIVNEGGGKRADVLMTVDDDNDGESDAEMSQVVKPGTCEVAIKTKGTGADKNRIIITTDSVGSQISLADTSAGGHTREINMRNLPSATVLNTYMKSPGHTTLVSSSAYQDSATQTARYQTNAPGHKSIEEITLRAGSARHVLAIDEDDDGDLDGDVSAAVTPGTSSMAISIKGTGADKNRVSSSVYADSTVEITTLSTAGGATREINSRNLPSATVQELKWLPSPGHTTLTRNSVYADSAEHITTVSTAGGGTSGIESKTKPKKATVTVQSLPSPGHTTLVRNSAGEDSAGIEVSVDTTGDNDPEGDYSAVVMPGTCSVAIKVKGTGADKNRVSSSVYEDSTVEITTLSTAGGGTSGIESKTKPKKATVTVQSLPSPGHTTLVRNSASEDSAGFEVSVDTTGDDHPEGSVSAHATPRSGSLAVVIEGAVRQGTFITTTPDSAHVDVSSGDESSISMSTKPTGVGTPGSSSLSLLHDDGLAGSSSVEMFADLIDSYLQLEDDGITTYRVSSSSGMQMMDNSGIAVTVIDRAGNAAFSNSMGVGVTSPTHPIEHSSGAHLTAGGTWTNASDVNLKENFEEVNGAELLDRLADLPISRWNYKQEEATTQHIGPTAQDFQKAFGVGSDGKSISTIDPSGIALAAIKELELRNQTLTQQNTQLQEAVQALLQRVDRLEKAGSAR